MTIGTLAARIMADASGIKSGMGLARSELKITRQAFIDSATDADKLNTALEQLSAARGKGAFDTEERYAAAVAAVREQLDPTIAAQRRATEETLRHRDALREEVATYGMSADQIQLWKMRQQGVDPVLVSNIAKLQDRRAAMQADATAMERGKQVTESVRTPTERYNATLRELNTLLASGRITQETYNRAVLQAGSAMDVAGVKARGMSVAVTSAMTSIASAMGVTFGAAGVVYAIRNAMNTYEEFAQAIASSTAIIVGATAEQRTAFEETAQQVAYQTRFSSKEAADAFYFLASAGLSVEQQISALPVVAKFAQAGMFDLSKATDLLTVSQSALGLTSEDAVENQREMIHIADVLVQANLLSQASVEQFAAALSNGAAPAMRQLNMSMEQGVAVLAAFAQQGTRGEEAGTAFQIVMRDLQRASINNAAAWKALNIEVYKGGQLRNVADIIGDLERALSAATPEQRKLTMEMLGFNDKSLKYTELLLGTSERIREFEKAGYAAAGMMEQVADNQMPELTKYTHQMRVEWEAFAIAFATPIAADLSGPREELGLLAETFATVLDAQEVFTSFWKMSQEWAAGRLLKGEIRDLQMQIGSLEMKKRVLPGFDTEAAQKDIEALRSQIRGYESQLVESQEKQKKWEEIFFAPEGERAGDKFREKLAGIKKELDLGTKATDESAAAANRQNAAAAGMVEQLQRFAAAQQPVTDETQKATEQIKRQKEVIDVFDMSLREVGVTFDESTRWFAGLAPDQSFLRDFDAFIEATDDVQKTIDETTRKLRDQIDTWGLTADAATLARLAAQGATEEQLAGIRELQTELDALQKQKDELNRSAAANTIEAGGMGRLFDMMRQPAVVDRYAGYEAPVAADANGMVVQDQGAFGFFNPELKAFGEAASQWAKDAEDAQKQKNIAAGGDAINKFLERIAVAAEGWLNKEAVVEEVNL